MSPEGCQISVQTDAWTKRDGRLVSFAMGTLERWMRSSQSVAVTSLGHSPYALWVLEAQASRVPCGSVECPQIVLREVRFNGRRYRHVLFGSGDQIPAGIDWRTAVHTQLTRFAASKMRGLRPARTDVASSGFRRHGGWVLRVRDSIHRKSYTWSLRPDRSANQCSQSLRLATQPWRI